MTTIATTKLLTKYVAIWVKLWGALVYLTPYSSTASFSHLTLNTMFISYNPNFPHSHDLEPPSPPSRRGGGGYSSTRWRGHAADFGFAGSKHHALFLRAQLRARIYVVCISAKLKSPRIFYLPVLRHSEKITYQALTSKAPPGFARSCHHERSIINQPDTPVFFALHGTCTTSGWGFMTPSFSFYILRVEGSGGVQT